MRKILIRKVARIGVRTIEEEEGRFYVTIRNRSYSSEHEVSKEVAGRHYHALVKE